MYIIAYLMKTMFYLHYLGRRYGEGVFAIVGPGKWMPIDVSPVKYSDSDSEGR